jgi:hypothetical protein
VGEETGVKLSLAALWEELKLGRVFEAALKSPKGHHFHGICDYERDHIVIDPATNAVDTLLHELIHRRHPRYGERRVRIETQKLMNAMDDDTKRAWYRKYRRIVKKRRPVEVDLDRLR